MTYDKDFLLELDKVKEKEIYAKVIALTFQETPITTIEGRITTGSINVDGNSAVRRTCSLTFVAQNFDYSNYFWGLNTKFKLEIGVKNNINTNYPDIIWFPQGIFILTSFNTSRSATNYSISLQGKDKMCLLNGEVGGSIESSVDFGVEEIVNELGYIELKKIPIPEIIRNMVHHYAGEPYYNIIINDLEEYGLELLEYRYDDDLYLYRSINSIYFDNILINPDTPCSVNGKPEIKKLSDLTPNELDLLVDTLTGTPNPSIVEMEGNEYYVAKVKFGQTAGYRETDLVYAGDLIANIGESITSVLDKIKTMLSDFEYFYNLDGQFVFQRKQAFINTLWSPISHETKDQEQYVESLAISSAYSYIFSGAELITSFNNNPNLLNMRNDYSIWGTREGIGRQDPVHMRYAIDTKPVYYKTIDGRIYMSDKTIFEQLKDQAKQDTLEKVHDRINNFNLGYSIPSNLQTPIKQADGSWSAGWWDIRDWHDYYYSLTLEEPKYTMKWYSRNDETGCIPCNTIPGYEDSNQWTWMIVATTKNDGTVSFSFGHGSGKDPINGSQYESTKMESYYDTNGKLVTVVSQPEEKRMIKSPYYGCHDSHTYLYFMKNEVSNTKKTYFYNPNFPSQSSFDEVVQDQIDKEYNDYLDSGILNFVDWREIIYQMALDYFKYGTEDDFEIRIRENNLDYYPRGLTGYEQYYTDIQGFWRYLYNPDLQDTISNFEIEKKKYDDIIYTLTAELYDWNDAVSYIDNGIALDKIPKNIPLFEDMIRYQNDKIVDLEEKKDPTLYNEIKEQERKLSVLQAQLTTLTSELRKNEELSQEFNTKLKNSQDDLKNYYYDLEDNDNRKYWNKTVYEYPEQLYFWFDFLDDSELTNFNVKTVGARPKVINDTAVKSIYFRETPDVIFVTAEQGIGNNSAFKYVQANDIEGMFRISAQGKSAKDRLDELIYSHGYCIENITINAIPIYYLQPNARIYLFDEKSGLNGDYIISKITIPLGYNGTMQITATKAAENII